MIKVVPGFLGPSVKLGVCYNLMGDSKNMQHEICCYAWKKKVSLSSPFAYGLRII